MYSTFFDFATNIKYIHKVKNKREQTTHNSPITIKIITLAEASGRKKQIKAEKNKKKRIKVAAAG
jgi:hypothetical protein